MKKKTKRVAQKKKSSANPLGKLPGTKNIAGAEKVRIRNMYSSLGYSFAEIKRRTGRSTAAIRRACDGLSNPNGPALIKEARDVNQLHDVKYPTKMAARATTKKSTKEKTYEHESEDFWKKKYLSLVVTMANKGLL